jgi:hypothetical protein
MFNGAVLDPSAQLLRSAAKDVVVHRIFNDY